MEVEARREVDRQRQASWQTARLGRVVHEPPFPANREVDAGQRSNLPGPRARRAHDRRRRDPPAGDVATPVTRPPSTSIPVAGSPCRIRAPPLRAAAAYPWTTASGSRVAVDRAKGRREEVGRLEPRDDRRRLVTGDLPGRNPQRVLELQGGAELGRVLLVVQQEEVARLVEVDFRADELGERGELLDRPERDAHVQLVCELAPGSLRPTCSWSRRRARSARGGRCPSRRGW